MELAPDFDEFIASLTAHGVEFVVVGAYALAFHGAPRFTHRLPTSSSRSRWMSGGLTRWWLKPAAFAFA
jgi:hypothetical protein